MNDLIARESLPLSEIIAIGNAFFASGLFIDVKTAAAAIVKIQAGNEIGIPPFASMSGIHLIQGKAMIGGHLIAAKIKASGKYDYKIVTSNEETCIIKFLQGKEVLGQMEFTKEKAVKAGTQNMAKWPEAMLFNRCISAGYKKFVPDVFLIPVYVPGEIVGTEDVEADVSTATPEQKADPATVVQMAKALPTESVVKAEQQQDRKPLDILNALHPNWVKVIQFVKDGGKIEDLSIKYQVAEDVAKMLQTVSPAPATQQVTQQQIHDDNAGYQGPLTQSDLDDPNRPF